MNRALTDLVQHGSVILALSLLFLACEDFAQPALDAHVATPEAERTPTLPEKQALEAALAGAKTATGAAIPSADRPEWTQKGASFVGESGRRYGVGTATGIKNAALARTTADNRARAEIAKLVGTKTEITEGDGSARVRTFAATLTEVEIVDHWVDPSDGTVYALARQAQ